MTNTYVAYPEILFLRLSKAQPDIYSELLAAANYRRYVFIHAGKAFARFDGKQVPLPPGTVLSIPAQARCELQFAKDCDGVWIGLLEEFLGSRVLPAIPRMNKPRSPFWEIYYKTSLYSTMVGAHQKALRAQVLRDLLAARERQGQGSDPIVAGYMLLILFGPSDAAPGGHITPDIEKLHSCLASSELLLEFRQLIDKHFRKHWNIDEYCKHLGVTPRRLLLACKNVTGKYPKVLIHERLMREARAELNYSKKSISEIAYDLGFESAAYFSRFFKRYSGFSPRSQRL